MLKYFEYSHLPEHLARVSKPFFDLAFILEETLPACEQKTLMFQKLLEAKDCAVRAALP